MESTSSLRSGPGNVEAPGSLGGDPLAKCSKSPLDASGDEDTAPPGGPGEAPGAPGAGDGKRRAPDGDQQPPAKRSCGPLTVGPLPARILDRPNKPNPGGDPEAAAAAQRMEDHPERGLLVSSAFFRDFQTLSAETVRFIISSGLDIAYAQDDREHIGKFPVYGPYTGKLLSVYAEPVPGDPNTYRLHGEDENLGA